MSIKKIYKCNFNGCTSEYNVGFGQGSNSNLCPTCKHKFRDAYKKGLNRKASDIVHEIKRNRNGERKECFITTQDVLQCWPVDNICPVLKEYMIPKTRFAATLDRINSDLPYTKDNIQVISYRANAMKNDAREIDLINFAKWVRENYE